MNTDPRRPSEASLPTFTPLNDAARSTSITIPSSKPAGQDGHLTSSKSPISPDTLNQYRMRLPHQLANGLNSTTYNDLTYQRPPARSTPSNNGVSPTVSLTTAASSANNNAQVKDLVAKFSQTQDSTAAYAPRKYSRTASGHSAVTGYRPSSSSSRAPSEAKSAGTTDTTFDHAQDVSSYDTGKSHTETIYRPYRTADTFYISDDQESNSDLHTSDGLSRHTSREQTDANRTLRQRPSESLLNIPGNLSSRYRATPMGGRPGGFEATRAYSSDRFTARGAGRASANERQNNIPSRQHIDPAALRNAPGTTFDTKSASTMPTGASPKSRLPTRTAYSASVSRRGSFDTEATEARRRPLTPPAHTSSGAIEGGPRPNSGHRNKSQSILPSSKLITPPRSSRPAVYARVQPSGSPSQSAYRTSSANTTVPPSPKLDRPGLSPRSNSENLLSQLSKAVSPPRLRLDLHDVHNVSLSGPATGGTDFEEDEYRLHDSGDRTLSPSKESSARATQTKHVDSQRVGSSGSMQNTGGATEPGASPSKVKDRIMGLRQRSSQLLSDVFQHSHTGADVPPARRSDRSEKQQADSHYDVRAQPEPGRWYIDPITTQRFPINEQHTQDRPISPDRIYAGLMTSPQRPFSSAMSAQSGRMTLDSDSYSVINRVLDQYHETGVVSPDMVYTFQQHILETDPELSARDDIDSLSIAKAALEDLVKDHSQSSLFKAHSQSSLFTNSPAKSSSSRQLGAFHNTSSSVDHLGIRSISHLEHSRDQTSLESPTLPGSDRGTALRLRHYSNANQLVSPYQANNTQPPDQDNEDIGPTPPPKDRQYSKSTKVDDRLANGDAQSQPMHASANRGPMLPEILSTGGGLGFIMARNSLQDLKQNSARDDGAQTQSTNPTDITRHARGPPSSPSLRVQSMATTQASTPPSEGVRAFSSKPSLELSGQTQGTPASSFERASSATVQEARSSKSGIELEAVTSTVAPSGPEDARLVKRRHIVKELVDTEFSFNQDMKVIEDIYKGTASAVEALTPDDRRILFGNSAQIVEFSEAFLDTLKHAAASVYVMPRTNKWRIKRGSVTVEPVDNSEVASVINPNATNEERDRKTTIGGAFGQHLSKMERVYGDYLRNHDLANQRLARLQTVPQVSLWLNECHTYASDITTAWDLDSLLVKPVQRILKYPLLLKTLVEATPADHPDYSALAVAMKQMTDISIRINESKKRAELLDQAVNRPNKKKDFDVSSGLSRAFGRRSEKLRQQVGMADAVEDFEYKAIAEKFGGQLFQLQVVMRDMEMYKKSVEEFIRQYSRIIEVIETMIELGPSTAPKTESKWRKFAMTIREMTAIIYVDHDNAIKKHCIEPIIALIKLHDKPQSLMAQRKKRLPEYAKFVLMKNKGEKLDKKTKQQGEEFIALNDTLKDELPKLFALNAKLVETCLRNYVDIQAQWQLNWQRKIGNVLKDHQQPTDFASIVEAFQNDFAYTEARVLALSICNGSLLADAAAFQSPAASTVFGTDDGSSLKRPSLLASQRSGSIAGNSPVIPEPDFLKHRSTGSFQMSLYSNRASLEPAMSSPSRNSSSTQLGSSVLNSFPPSATANKTRRHRSGSASSSIHSVRSIRSPLTPQLPLLSRNASAQTVAFGPYQPNDRANARSSNPGPASPTQTRSPLISRFSQNSTRSTHTSSSATKSPEITFHAASSPAVVQLPTMTRTTSSSHTQQAQAGASAPDPSVRPSRPRPSHQAMTTVSTARGPQEFPVLFLAASLFEFNIDRSRKEAGYPYLTYVPGEIFDVIGEKGELWLAKNQDDQTGLVGWIWEKHFAKLVPDAGGNVRHAAAVAVTNAGA